LIAELMRGVAPELICQQLQICNATSTPDTACNSCKIAQYFVNKQNCIFVCFTTLCVAKPEAPWECFFCEESISELESYIQKEHINSTTIEDDLLLFCTYLPVEYRTQCTTYVKSYGPILIAELMRGVAPELICQQLQICNATSTPDTACNSCKIAQYFVNKQNSQKLEGKSFFEASEALAKHCSKPYFQCSSFVSKAEEAVRNVEEPCLQLCKTN